jgi:hypothetical protein
MKRSIRVLKVLASALIILSAGNCHAQKVAETSGHPPKKVVDVKVVVKKDGKLIEKDTAIVGGESRNFTFNTGEMTVVADSLYHSMGDDTKGKTVTVTVFDDGKASGKGNQKGTHTYTYTIGDSLQKNGTQKLVRKIEGKPVIIMENGDGKTFDEPVWQSGSADRVILQRKRDPFAFDPTDPTIVSYKKKDVGKDEERITIVRKKAVQDK